MNNYTIFGELVAVAFIFVKFIEHWHGIMVNAQNVINVDRDIRVIGYPSFWSFHLFVPQIQVGRTGCVAKVLHAIHQVSLECCTSAFQSIECTDNNGRLACVGTKF
jgi:hypothetical protein